MSNGNSNNGVSLEQQFGKVFSFYKTFWELISAVITHTPFSSCLYFYFNRILLFLLVWYWNKNYIVLLMKLTSMLMILWIFKDHLGIKDNQSSGKPTAGRYVPPHMRNRSDRATTTISENSSRPQQQLSRNKDNSQYSNESDELVPPLQTRRPNGWQHQRNERYLLYILL